MRIESVGIQLRSISPQIYRLAQPAWWILKRSFSRKRYWNRRREFAYYRVVLELSRKYVPAGTRVIDVGASDTEVLDQLGQFTSRVALDNRYTLPRRGIQHVRMDFMDYRPTAFFDLVLCLQVMEHLANPRAFARKLLETGRTVIISAPYRWPAGALASHRQDPVDEEKLRCWTGQDPLESLIVPDARERLIAVYRGERPPGRSHGTDRAARSL